MSEKEDTIVEKDNTILSHNNTVERNSMNGVVVISTCINTGNITKRYISTPKKSGMLPKSQKLKT